MGLQDGEGALLDANLHLIHREPGRIWSKRAVFVLEGTGRSPGKSGPGGNGRSGGDELMATSSSLLW
jgi:hypothetical protein